MTKKMIKALFLVCMFMPVFSQTTTELPDPVKITSVEGITEYQLDNGLRVLLFPDPTKQTITVNVTYLVGSKHENYGETGMAHLLEHLVFKGTPRHPNIPQELTERGASPNGTTWTDRTNYFETFSATEDNLNWALDLEADRMVNSFISKEDLDSEMTVVRNEFESGENSPFRVLWQRIMSAAFDWHNYGKSTIGARSDIENVPIERLQAFYRKYYQPDNAVLVVAGKIDEEKTLKLVNEYFGSIPRPERTILPTYTRDPEQDGERMVTVRRVGDTQMIGVGFKTCAASHPDAAALDVLNNILGNTPSGRMYKALIDTKKAANVFTFNFQWKEPGFMLAMTEVPKDKSIDEAKAIMIETLDNIRTEAPTPEEVERAKNTLIKQIELAFNSSERIGLQLSESIGSGDWRLLFINRDRLKDVTVDDVIRVANNYLKPDNRTVGQFIPIDKPDRTKIPEDVDIAALVKDYTGTQNIVMGEEFDPTPSNIDTRTSRMVLDNGLKVAMLPKKTRGESVQVRMTFRFGDIENLWGKAKAGQMTATLLNRGTSKMTREEIKDAFDKLKANVNIFGSATILAVNIETTKNNLTDVMALLNELLKDPSFPEDEFEKAVLQQITSIESNMSEPSAVGSNKLAKYVDPYKEGDPRYAETFEESISNWKKLTLDEVKQFYKDFYGANHGTIGIAGDFDESEMKKMISDMFGEWNSPASYTRLVSEIKEIETLNLNVETPDKANAFFLALQQFEMRDDHMDYPAMLLGNFMLGGGFLNSRLATRIRQNEGISYGVGSFFNAGSIDNVASLNGYAIYAPENVERLEAAFKEEIEKIINEGFTEEEVTAAKSGWLQSRSVNRAQDASLAMTLNNYEFLNRTLAWDQDLEDKVAALTTDQINAVMKKYIKPEKIHMVKAGDFAKVDQQD